MTKPTATKRPPWFRTEREWAWMVRYGDRAPLSIVEQIRRDAKQKEVGAQNDRT